jgi:hypothetical protein
VDSVINKTVRKPVMIKNYHPRSRRTRREEDPNASATLRDKKYDGQEFLTDLYSGKNAVISSQIT